MRLTRRDAIQTIATIGPMVLLGAKGASAASDAAEIDRDAAAALRRLYAAEHRTVGLGQKAAGILVFPKIVKAGFIFGAQGGKGVLSVLSDWGGRGQATFSLIGPVGRLWV